MAQLQLQTTVVVTRSIDTDDFNADQWREFIKAYVPVRDIVRILNSADMSPLDTLKARAIQYAQRPQLLDFL